MADGGTDGNRVDVTLHFTKNDRGKADEIKNALMNLDLRVESEDDLIPGSLKLSSSFEQMEKASCNVFIVTSNFVQDKSQCIFNELAAVLRQQKNNPNVIPVIYPEDVAVPLLFSIYVSIDGSLKPDGIAKQILKSVQDIREKKHKTIYLNCYKPLSMVNTATDVLVDYFALDATMKDLFGKMKATVDHSYKMKVDKKINTLITPTSGCDCSEGELWKLELLKQEHWKKGYPMPFRNLEKFKNDHINKHTASLHDLYDGNSQNHVKLAMVFQPKRQQFMEYKADRSSICDYLDTDGIFQLLKTCAAFSIGGDNASRSTDMIHKARHLVAHVPLNYTRNDHNEIMNVVHKAASSLYGVVSVDVWTKLYNKLEEIKLMNIEARVEIDKRVGSEVEWSEFHTDTQQCTEGFESILDELRQDVASEDIAAVTQQTMDMDISN